SLDLTGPLLLGGVPKLPEDFPVRNQQFVGCMKNLRIDNQHVDMASYIANNGTLPGNAPSAVWLFTQRALFCLFATELCLLVGQPSMENPAEEITIIRTAEGESQ
ncbi:hypothetical protein GOODEAATRI_013849, partial [Goodea atripinnis]